MQNDNESRKLKNLKEELHLIQRQLELLRLIQEEEEKESKKTSNNKSPCITKTFPVGTIVTFTGQRENKDLRNKKATVIGHTAKFVKVRKGGKDYRRAPENLTKQNEE